MQHNPRTVLRQVPNVLLARFFSRHAGFEGFDWSRTKESQIEAVYESWQRMPETERHQIGNLLRQVQALANAHGTATLVAAARDGGLDVLADITAMKNAYERAFWCLLEYSEVFHNGRILAHIDSLPQQSTEKWTGLQNGAIDVTNSLLADLEQAIAFYFQKRDGRGERCRVEYRRRFGTVDSFFAYPADYADEILGYGEDGELARQPWRGAFEVVFAYDGAEGTLELYAQGGRQVRNDLCELFVRVVLNQDQKPQPAEKPPYRMDVFKNRQLAFPTDPTDRIHVRVQGLRIKPDCSDGVISVDAGRRSWRSAYALLDEVVDQQRLPLEETTILDATLQAVVETQKRPRSITFRVTPSSCTLGDSQEEEKLKRYLKQWRIEDEQCA